MRDFTYNGVTLSSFGGRILQKPSHTVARRNIDRVKIYGQSGDEIIDNESYDNVDFSLKVCFLPHLTAYSAQELSQRVINWLAPLQNSYYVYRDTYNPGYFTKAVLTNFDEVVRELMILLTATLKFTRVPFWYADSGSTSVTFTDQGYFVNPEIYPSEPIFDLVYTGDLTNITLHLLVGNKAIDVPMGSSASLSHQILDGVAKQHYCIDNGTKIYISDLLPPDLQPGSNIISLSHSAVACTLTPNWRRL